MRGVLFGSSKPYMPAFPPASAGFFLLPSLIMPGLGFIFVCIKTLLWDIYLNIANLLTPNAKPGRLIPAGMPGAGGKWPEFVSPKAGDSRCSCPALNAMANHGEYPTYRISSWKVDENS